MGVWLSVKLSSLCLIVTVQHCFKDTALVHSYFLIVLRPPLSTQNTSDSWMTRCSQHYKLHDVKVFRATLGPLITQWSHLASSCAGSTHACAAKRVWWIQLAAHANLTESPSFPWRPFASLKKGHTVTRCCPVRPPYEGIAEDRRHHFMGSSYELMDSCIFLLKWVCHTQKQEIIGWKLGEDF